MRGRVKNINDEREFGFILGEDTKDYFFHFSNVMSVDLPTKNAIVEFEPQNTGKGLAAVNIKILEKKSRMINIDGNRVNPSEVVRYSMYNEFDWESIDQYIVRIEFYHGRPLKIRGTKYECERMMKILDEAIE